MREFTWTGELFSFTASLYSVFNWLMLSVLNSMKGVLRFLRERVVWLSYVDHNDWFTDIFC